MSRKTFNPFVNSVEDNQILVYVGNTVGRVEKSIVFKLGGARFGVIEGMNSSKFYALPLYIFNNDKDRIDKPYILMKIRRLYHYALQNPKKEFLVAYHGIDILLCKYTKEEMAALFSQTVIPKNIIFDEHFNSFIK